MNHKTFNWNEFPDLPEEKYISSAIEINEILHNAGINKNKRARFLAGLVLSSADNTNIDLRQSDTIALVETINASIKSKLRKVEKENFIDFLKLELPPTPENHTKYKKAIVETIKELQTLDIQNAMASGKDILGEFYEKFLKYGNGAKEIGIVLTPRHVTEFAVDVVGINYNDYILDPTCGTGGFLVASFDHIRKSASLEQIESFKKNNIFGIEQDDEVVALALVNMIFRGDGRNNIKEGNCFQKNIESTVRKEMVSGFFQKRSNNAPTKPLITKVLMNPPFALKKGDEKERNFIDYALSQMQDNGILFAIVPISVMVEDNGKLWRKELLQQHTVISVITLPTDLFYPVNVGTVGIFIKKGVAHDYENQNVYFARIVTDGLRKKKGKRIRDSRERNQLAEIHDELRSFIINQNYKVEDIPEFKKVCKLDRDDEKYEIVPETYIDNKPATFEEVEEGIDQAIRNSLSYLIQNKKIFNTTRKKQTVSVIGDKSNIKFEYYPLIFQTTKEGDGERKGLCIIEKQTADPQNALEQGETPYVTTSSLNNGVSGFFDIEPNSNSKCLTVALNGSVGEVFFQFEDFVTSSDNAILRLQGEYNPFLLYYIAYAIKKHQWRYNYYRKLTTTKLKKLLIPIPCENNQIALHYIESVVRNSYGFCDIQQFL